MIDTQHEVVATMNNRVLPLAAIAAAALSGTTSAQLDCSCSPQAFTLKINLSGTCPASITNVVTNNDDFCHVTKDDGTTPGIPADLFGFPSDQNFDEVPTEIESISYYELNESLEAISQDTIAVDGSVNEVTFTSVTANLDPELFLSEQTQNVVSAAFLVISGKNADGISVKNTVTWQYDLEMCDKIPMAIGDTIGWVDVVGLKYAKAAFCPVFPATMEPTASPTFEFHKKETTTEATATTPTSMSMSMGTKSSKHAKASSAKASNAKSSKTSTPGSYGAGEDPIANSKASTKSSKVVSAHTKSSKTVDTKVQKASSAGSYEYEYGGYHSMPNNSQDNKSGNSKHSTKSTKGTKSSKASSSIATTSVVAVNSKQSTKSSKTKSAKAVGTSDAKAKKPHEGSMSTGWSAGGGRWLIDAGSYSYGAGKGPIAYSKASTKSSKVVSAHTKSSKTVDTKVQKASSAGSYEYEYGGYHSMPNNSQDNKSGNSKHSTKSTKGTKSSKASSSIATTSVVAVNSKQSTKSSKTKSAKAVGTSDAKKPHEGSMSTGWSAGSVRW